MTRLRGGPTTGGSSERIEWYFGELIDEVALRSPVCRARLVHGLAAVDRRGHEVGCLRDRAVGTTETAEGDVYVLPVAEWGAISEGLLPVTRVAVRETHRRMARALHTDPLPPRTDPYVLVSRS